MSPLELILTIVVIGVVVWIANAVLPISARVKRMVNGVAGVVIGIILLVWLLGFLGIDLRSNTHPRRL